MRGAGIGEVGSASDAGADGEDNIMSTSMASSRDGTASVSGYRLPSVAALACKEDEDCTMLEMSSLGSFLVKLFPVIIH